MSVCVRVCVRDAGLDGMWFFLLRVCQFDSEERGGALF